MSYFFVSSLTFLIFLITYFNTNNKKLNKVLTVFSVVIIVFFIGLRFETGGPDWMSYQSFFKALEPISDLMFNPSEVHFIYDHGFEPLFKLYSSCIKVLTGNYIWLNFISSVLTFSILFSFFSKASPYPVLSLYLYFCTVALLGDMTIVRQMIAVSIFIFSLKFIVNKNLYKYLLCCFVAIMFHYSAIILVPVYWLSQYFSKARFYIPLMLAAALVSLVFTNSIVVMLDYLLNGFSWGFAITLKLKQYLLEAGETSVNIGIGSLERIIVLIFIIKYSKVIIRKYPVYGKLIISLSVMNIFLSVLFLNFPMFYMRFRYYFIFSNSILYVYMFTMFRQRLLLMGTFYVYGLLWVSLVIFSNANQYLPYTNFIEYVFTNNKVDRVQMIERGFN
jgi:hypothetical protein